MPKSLDPHRAKPEECVPCLFLTYSSARYIIFYLHSNAEDVGRCHSFCSSLRTQFQVHVFAVEYPGYGICPCPEGGCNEQRVTENAFTGFRFLHEVLKWPLDSIILLGRSIGCGPAISLAVQYPVSGVIVVSPMLSVKELTRDSIGPFAQLVDERFPNRERVPNIRSPFLVVHGKKDAMIPCRHGVELYNLCRSRKLLVCPKDMEHNTNLLANVTYFVLPILQFFSLPDYCFEDLQVPRWAYDKRLSPFYKESTISTSVWHCASPDKQLCEVAGSTSLSCPSGPGVSSEPLFHKAHQVVKGVLLDGSKPGAPSAPALGSAQKPLKPTECGDSGLQKRPVREPHVTHNCTASRKQFNVARTSVGIVSGGSDPQVVVSDFVKTDGLPNSAAEALSALQARLPLASDSAILSSSDFAEVVEVISRALAADTMVQPSPLVIGPCGDV